MGNVKLNTKVISVILLVALTSTSLATTMIPIPIKDKLEDTDAVIVGKVVSKTFKRHPVLNVVTEAKLEIEKAVGIDNNSHHSNKFIGVTYPGGTWAGMTYAFPGTPNFEIGEKTAVMVKKNAGSLFVHHLGGGKFNFFKKDGKEYLRAEVYADKEGVGLISFNKFEKVLRESHFQKGLSAVSLKREIYVAKGNSEKLVNANLSGRQPASVKENNRKIASVEKEKRNDITRGFLIAIFIMMGLFFTFNARKEQ